MVTLAVKGATKVAPSELTRLASNFSFNSRRLSDTIGTDNVVWVTPGVNVSVPLLDR